jgi:hypothetical protein
VTIVQKRDGYWIQMGYDALNRMVYKDQPAINLTEVDSNWVYGPPHPVHASGRVLPRLRLSGHRRDDQDPGEWRHDRRGRAGDVRL